MNDLMHTNSELAGEIGETTEVSWTPPEHMTYEQYERIGRTFQQINRSLAWWLGDWMVHGEKKFGEMYAQAIEMTNLSVETLMKYKAVAERVGKDIRQASLSWTHHFYVAYVEDDQRGDLLAMAANLGLSSRELKDVAKLDWHARLELLAAEDAGVSKEDFMRLLNKLRLGQGYDEDDESGARPEEDDEDDLPFTDLDESDADPIEEFSPYDGEGETVGLDLDTVLDYWEQRGAPVKFVGKREIIWEGMAVRAALENGEPVLIWEEIP